MKLWPLVVCPLIATGINALYAANFVLVCALSYAVSLAVAATAVAITSSPKSLHP
jgi:hypothetical protein